MPGIHLYNLACRVMKQSPPQYLSKLLVVTLKLIDLLDLNDADLPRPAPVFNHQMSMKEQIDLLNALRVLISKENLYSH